jgi:hypothetical protein
MRADQQTHPNVIIWSKQTIMNNASLFQLALIGLLGVGIQHANAGSAVAWDGHGHFSTAYGGPVEREKQRALDTAHRKGWANAKIIAATDMPGYGAIAVALHPNGYGSVIGISIGKRSATEANTLAIGQCLKLGGTNPKVRWSWRG